MTKKQEVPTTTILVLNAILQKISDLIRHLDTQANITIALSSVIFTFSASKVYELDGKVPLYLLTLGALSGLSGLAALLAVHPPRSLRKKGQRESLLYHREVAGFTSSEEYAKDLLRIVGDEEKIVEQYAREIYNVSRYLYRPKREFFKLARNLLIIGLFLSFVLFLSHL